jgi:hypothetical protein
LTSLISISDRDLHRGRWAIPLEPSNGRPSRAIPGPVSVIQDMRLNDTHKGREAFSKAKALLRRAQARVLEALFEATEEALLAISAQDACSYFEDCGYAIQQAHSI